MAATVLIAVTLGGGGWLWNKAEQEAEQARVARDINQALNKATLLQAQAKTSPLDGDDLYAQAREQAQAGLVRNPENAMLKTCLAVNHMNMGDFDRALDALAQIEETPDTIGMTIACLEALGRGPEADQLRQRQQRAAASRVNPLERN